MKRNSRYFLGLLMALSLLPATPAMPRASVRQFDDYGRMPLYFIENKGQTDSRIAYYVQGSDKALYFTEEGVTYVLSAPETTGRLEAMGFFRGTTAPAKAPLKRHVVKLEFKGASPVRPKGEAKASAVVSYFTGKPSQWKTGLPTYRKVVYTDLWPGVDLVYEGTVNRLKYAFSLRPGTEPSTILLAYRGADVTVTDAGDLRVSTSISTFFDEKPVAYQDGKLIPCSFELKSGTSEGESVYGFTLGDYDRTRPVVIDPAVLIYCGYVGGDGHDEASSIAADSAGNAYVAGYTNSQTTFPVQVGPDTGYNGGTYDAFVAKVNAGGTALDYCGFIGGSGDDRAYGIAVDGAGNAYLAGDTLSDETTFPVKNGPGLTGYVGTGDAFVAKVNTSGTSLDYCGFIAGFDTDHAQAIAVDGAGHAYVTGYTGSTKDNLFPVTIGPATTIKGMVDAFVAKVKVDGTGFVYCGYIGGDNYDRGYGVAVDGTGNAYIVGDTRSTDGTFPVTVGPDLSHNGGYDGFVAKVNDAGTALTYCGYIGGSSFYEAAYAVSVDGNGNAYVAGSTKSTESTFPVIDGPDLSHNGGYDAFVAKVNVAGNGLSYCGYIGGSGDDHAGSIAVGADSNAYVAGSTKSTESTFPVIDGPDLIYNGGEDDGFVAKVNSSGNALSYCGYIGGSASDKVYGIALGSAGSAYVAGTTTSGPTTFPVAVGPSLIHQGYTEAFAAKISASSPPPTSGFENPAALYLLLE